MRHVKSIAALCSLYLVVCLAGVAHASDQTLSQTEASMKAVNDEYVAANQNVVDHMNSLLDQVNEASDAVTYLSDPNGVGQFSITIAGDIITGRRVTGGGSGSNFHSVNLKTGEVEVADTSCFVQCQTNPQPPTTVSYSKDRDIAHWLNFVKFVANIATIVANDQTDQSVVDTLNSKVNALGALHGIQHSTVILTKTGTSSGSLSLTVYTADGIETISNSSSFTTYAHNAESRVITVNRLGTRNTYSFDEDHDSYVALLMEFTGLKEEVKAGSPTQIALYNSDTGRRTKTVFYDSRVRGLRTHEDIYDILGRRIYQAGYHSRDANGNIGTGNLTYYVFFDLVSGVRMISYHYDPYHLGLLLGINRYDDEGNLIT